MSEHKSYHLGNCLEFIPLLSSFLCASFKKYLFILIGGELFYNVV